MNAQQYQQYLTTDHWQQLRIQCLSRYKRACVICRTDRQLECHHWKYRATPYDTILKDLVLLCHACHRMVHRHKTDTLDAAELRDRYANNFMSKPRQNKIRKKDRWQELRDQARAKMKNGNSAGRPKGMPRKQWRAMQRAQNPQEFLRAYPSFSIGPQMTPKIHY